MKGRKRSIATRRKKEEVLLAKEAEGICRILFIVAGAALVGSFLKGLIIGYFVGKNR